MRHNVFWRQTGASFNSCNLSRPALNGKQHVIVTAYVHKKMHKHLQVPIVEKKRNRAGFTNNKPCRAAEIASLVVITKFPGVLNEFPAP